jgi:hypothetical protein
MENNNNSSVFEISKADAFYQPKIESLNSQIKKMKKENEWKIFNENYNRDARQKKYSETEMCGVTLLLRYHLSEAALSIDPDYPEWSKQQFESILEMQKFSAHQHIFLLKDEYESKQKFVDQCKKDKCCCIIS